MTSFTYYIAGLMGMGPTELLVIAGIVLLLFGGAKLPSLAKGLGQSVKEFKKAAKEIDEEEKPAEPKKADPVKTSTPGAN